MQILRALNRSSLWLSLALLFALESLAASPNREIPEVVIEISASVYFRPALHFDWQPAEGSEELLRQRIRDGLRYSASLSILDSIAVDTTAAQATPAPEGEWGSITVLNGSLQADSLGNDVLRIALRDVRDSLEYASWHSLLTAGRENQLADSLCDEVLQLLTGRKSIVGSRIIFTRASQKGRTRNLFSCSIFGDDIEQLSRTPSLKFSPDLSPDGNWLVYAVVREQTGADLYLLPLENGGRARPLLDSPESDTAPAWSPDGRWIACASTRDGNTDLYLLPAGDDAMGRNERRLSFDSGIDTSPAWSPDSRHLVYCSDRAGGLQIYSCTVEGLEHKRISWFGYSNDCPAWSPDGEWIAFVTRERKGYQLCIMRPDGSDARRLSSAPGNHFDPSWSPDGTQLVYSWKDQLWIIFVDGSGRRPLLSLPGGAPSWVGSQP